MKLSLAILGCFLAVFVAYASADCSVTVKQTLGSSWTSNGQAYSQWNSQLVASGSEAVTAVTLTIAGGDIDQLWELVEENDGSYRLPDYRKFGGIPAGQSHQFGYIIKTSSQATVTVTAKSCGSSAASPSPAAPSASASPAAPSASASPAAPSPSSSAVPSTVVSTPQPSLTPQSCTIKVTQTARTTADGHWTSGDFQFQIYDLVITNNGSYPVSQAEISFQLAGEDDTIYQFWNLQREQADIDVFVIPTPWGALQVGASQGAGYIVRSPVSAGKQVAPGFIPGVATCVYDTTPSASPSPSASPAASASASPSSSSGPIVSTPQPSSPAQGCAAKATLVARSEAAGGKWDDGAYSFQIYDLTVSNSGSKPVKAAQATFTLASGTSISQWWELNQVSAAVFNVAFNYGNLQVGASQGAGVVERYAKGTTPDAPTVSLGSVACA